MTDKQIIILLLVLLPILVFSQNKRLIFPDSEFNTIFAKTKEGNFKGTVNGLLIIQDNKHQKILIDAQGANAEFKLIPDEHEAYDVSTKSYIGKSTSGRTEFRYSTYGMANKLEIDLKGKTYSGGIFDGAYDMVINGLKYQYISETGMEYLILQVEKAIELDTYWWLRNRMGISPQELKQAKVEMEKIQLLPGSVLVFAIKTT